MTGWVCSSAEGPRKEGRKDKRERCRHAENSISAVQDHKMSIKRLGDLGDNLANLQFTFKRLSAGDLVSL